MPRKPLSEAAKKAFARSRKLSWVRKKLDKEEKALRITAPIDRLYRQDTTFRRIIGQRKVKEIEDRSPPLEPFGEEEFEREMKIGWRRDD